MNFIILYLRAKQEFVGIHCNLFAIKWESILTQTASIFLNQNSYFIEFLFYREKIAMLFKKIDSHFQKNKRFGLEIPVV